jgi:leucyl-tRNA synthetase
VAPPEKEVEWSDAGLEGSYRFLNRVWRLVDQVRDDVRVTRLPDSSMAFGEAERQIRRRTHETIRRVTVDVEQRVHLNTAVSALMELVNDLHAYVEGHPLGSGTSPAGNAAVVKEAVEALVLMLSPFAPHMAEELWERLGRSDGLARAAWPVADPAVARAEEMVVPVQVNGKLRSRLTVPADTTEGELRERALADPAVRAHTTGKTVKTVVVAKGKLVNVVVQ